MPTPDVMTPLGLEWLTMLPPMFRDEPYVQAIIHARAVEKERQRDALDRVRRNLIPATADELGLPYWEALCRITVNPVGLTVQQRRDRVLAAHALLLAAPSGENWEEGALALLGNGFTYREYDPGDPTGPPPATVRVVIPFDPDAGTAQEAEGFLRGITAAHLDLEVTYASGFILDRSALDQQGFS